MSKYVVEAWNVEDAEQLMSAIGEALEIAKGEGHSPDTVYPNRRRVTLVRETLSDGSKVMKICMFDGEG